MDDWVIPAPLAQPVPRKAGITRPRLMLTVFLTLSLCAPFGLFVDVILIPEHQLTQLATRGIDIAGTVVGLTSGYPSHARGYHGPWGDFVYAPKGSSGQPGDTIRASLKISEQDYEALTVGKPVSLVYDPLDPKNVDTKSVVERRRHRTGRPYWVSGLILVLLIPGILAALTMPFVLAPYFREKHLLRFGIAARVTIVSRIDVPVENGTRIALNYTFHDEKGAIGRGEIDLFQEDGKTITLPSTVVYDPHASDRTMLYPGRAAALRG